MKALDVSPDFGPAYVQLGESYLFDEPRDFAIAENYMEKILALQPNEYRSHDLIGDVHPTTTFVAEFSAEARSG